MKISNCGMPAMPMFDSEGLATPFDDHYTGLIRRNKVATGLTKREMMAMHMMQGLMSTPSGSAIVSKRINDIHLAFQRAEQGVDEDGVDEFEAARQKTHDGLLALADVAIDMADAILDISM